MLSPVLFARTDGSPVSNNVLLYSLTLQSYQEIRRLLPLSIDGCTVTDSVSLRCLSLFVFIASIDGGITGRGVSLQSCTQHGFAELGNLL